MRLQMYTFVVTYANLIKQTPSWRRSTGHPATQSPSGRTGIRWISHGIPCLLQHKQKTWISRQRTQSQNTRHRM